MALPNIGMNFTPYDTLTAAELDNLVENIEALADGTGINDASITQDKLATGADFATGWNVNALPIPTTVVANGNRSYTLTHASSIASVVSPGMRRRFTRTVASTNTCFSLDGSNDYYVKTSPSGMTFTDDFSVSAWVYMTSYAVGIIASRTDTNSGWRLFTTASGQVYLQGTNANAANFSRVVSYQSLPINKWVHIAAQLDMSTYTATTTTSYIMIDGVNVPTFVERSGTNPTALVQAGHLNIGAENGGSNPFPGYIDQVAIYSAKVTQATHLAAMNQPLTGSETSLISAYSNGSTTDLAATGNNLTATNGATTATSAPWGNRGTSTTLEYGLTMSVSSDGLTEVVQCPEGCALPTTGGITASAYSSMANPYGCPTMGEVVRQVQARSTFSAGPETDVYGMTITENIPAGRYVEVEYFSPQGSNSVDSTRIQLKLYEDSTVIQNAYHRTWTTGNGGTLASIKTTINPTAGSHTYKVSLTSLGGTASLYADATSPMFLIVRYKV